MADTIVTNTPGTSSDGGAAGMIVALVFVVAAVLGGVVLYQRGFFSGSGPADTTNINVTIPNPVTGGGANK